MNRRMIICELVAICVFVGSMAHVRGDSCLDVTPMKDFNLTQLAGRWYLVKSFTSQKKELGNCETLDFITDKNGTFVAQHGFTNGLSKPITIRFIINPMDDSNPGKLTMKFCTGDEAFHLSVLKTDYESYAVIHCCEKFGGQDSWGAYIMTREKRPGPAQTLDLESYISMTNISATYHNAIPHHRCSYAPVPTE